MVAADWEDPLPDRTSRPAEGDRPSYELPNSYGPALNPWPDDLDDTPAVRLREIDDDSPAPDDRPSGDGTLDHTAVATTTIAPPPNTRNDGNLGDNDAVNARFWKRGAATTETLGAPPPEEGPESVARSRREIREHREREQQRRKPKRWRRRIIALVVVALLTPVGVSYVHALQRPGIDTIGVRTVEWIRDHGGNGIVNTIERWWYTNNPPPVGGKPRAIHVQGTTGEVTTPTKPNTPTTLPRAQRLTPPTARVATPAAVVEPNEGVWAPTGRLVGGAPAVYSTYVRPDAAHTSYYTALMWLDTKLLRAAYVPGLQEPSGAPNPWGAQVPGDQRESLVAAFNSGFKMDSARGGVWIDGQEIKHLVDGAASLVIFKDGSATVGKWGRDVGGGTNITAVRQNLELIVDNGQLNPLLQESDNIAFGATLGGNVFVWRSGVGVDANGGLIYAGGPAMSITALARTLQAAGAVNAMELDINTDWVSAYTYAHADPSNTTSPIVGTKLLDSMSHGGDRYLQPGERDFFAFFGNPKPEAPVTTTTTTKPGTSSTPGSTTSSSSTAPK
ncbi:MAG TPA: hypothetical protein VGA62_02375 [Acidimicrobiia bacterium]